MRARTWAIWGASAVLAGCGAARSVIPAVAVATRATHRVWASEARTRDRWDIVVWGGLSWRDGASDPGRAASDPAGGPAPDVTADRGPARSREIDCAAAWACAWEAESRAHAERDLVETAGDEGGAP